jgi:hypothetical protein
MCAPVFHVRKGTPGLVRRLGGKWRPHRATKDLAFPTARRHKGGHLIFARGDWEFMVLARHADGGTGQPYQYARTFNRCILGRNGRGASRRRALRRRRR